MLGRLPAVQREVLADGRAEFLGLRNDEVMRWSGRDLDPEEARLE